MTIEPAVFWLITAGFGGLFTVIMALAGYALTDLRRKFESVAADIREVRITVQSMALLAPRIENIETRVWNMETRWHEHDNLAGHRDHPHPLSISDYHAACDRTIRQALADQD